MSSAMAGGGAATADRQQNVATPAPAPREPALAPTASSIVGYADDGPIAGFGLHWFARVEAAMERPLVVWTRTAADARRVARAVGLEPADTGPERPAARVGGGLAALLAAALWQRWLRPR